MSGRCIKVLVSMEVYEDSDPETFEYLRTRVPAQVPAAKLRQLLADMYHDSTSRLAAIEHSYER